MQIPIKTGEEIEKMRAACKITAGILDAVGEIVRPGITTEQINTFIHNMTLDAGATPATLNYKGYPKSACISINDVICHGIPSPYEVLKEGDILNIDVTSIKNGYFGDASRMFTVGEVSEEAHELIITTKKALQAGIDSVKPGAHIGDIGAAIKRFIDSTGKGYGIVREYTGHGIGRKFHEPPQVVHIAKAGSGSKIQAGMTFTIEPMINAGTAKTVLSRLDGWTVRTADGQLSAQWEHTILVTDDGAEKLTQSLNGQDY